MASLGAIGEQSSVIPSITVVATLGDNRTRMAGTCGSHAMVLRYHMVFGAHDHMMRNVFPMYDMARLPLWMICTLLQVSRNRVSTCAMGV